jgi:hypothetical protein
MLTRLTHTTTISWAYLSEFAAYHGLVLQRDEVRHGLILNALTQADRAISVELSRWTLGGPGECAIRMGQHSIVLGTLDEDQCRKLADLTVNADYPGVIGPDITARWFTDRAAAVAQGGRPRPLGVAGFPATD